jgi:hypothetical protein
MKKSWKVLASIATAAALVMAPVAMSGAVAAQPSVASVHTAVSKPTTVKADDTSHKVFVCKYVATPEVREYADHIISVSVSTIKGWDGVTLPFVFTDAHQRSVAIAFDTGQAEPSVEDCPGSDDLIVIEPAIDVTPASCDEAGTATFTPDEGVTWSAVKNSDGSTTYTASPAEGYRFPDLFDPEFTVPSLKQLSPYSEECSTPEVVPPTVDVAADCFAEHALTVTLDNPNDVDVEATIAIDGVEDTATVPANNSVILTYDYTESTTVPVVVTFDGTVIYDEDAVIACDEEGDEVPVPAEYSADPTGPTCDVAGSLPDVSGLFEHVSLSFDREYDGPGSYTLTALALDGYTFPDGTTEKSRDITIAGATGTQSTDHEAPCYVAPTDDPPLIPGDIESACVGDVPYLGYSLSLPEGYVAQSPTPLSITFLHPTDPSQNYTVSNLPLTGTLLWPGASATEPLQWPGWQQLADGTYVETTGNYAWTRDGVTVLFEVNPSYQTVVEYPPASALCANPAALTVVPTDPTDPAALASTGGADMRPWAIGAAAALMAGAALLFMRRAVRR